MKISITALYTCGETIAPPDWDTSMMPRPYRLYYVIDGKAYYTVGGEKKELKKGHFYLFPSSMPFNVVQDSNARLNHLYYDFMMTPSVVSPEPLFCSAEDNILMISMLSVMRQSIQYYCCEGKHELFDTVVSSLATFLSLFLEITKPSKTIDSDIVTALTYIEQNYSDNISVKEIASLVFLDEDYFIKKFKKCLGITPYSYIRNLRMAVVKELRHNGVSLNRATSLAGFKYASSYCRAKKK